MEADARVGIVVEGARAQAGEAAPATVLVVDDHQTFAELLALALGTEPSLRYVGHARTSADADRLVAELAPDVVLMDVQLPDVDGLTTTERLVARYPDLRVVVLTAHTDASLVARAGAAGACGFLPKDGALRDVLHALRTAHRGGMVVSTPLLSGPAPVKAAPARTALVETALVETAPVGAAPVETARVGAARASSQGARVAALTAREQDVLRLMGNGMDVRAIARELGISPHTCRGYVKGILAKLGVHSQLEAVVTALRRGLLTPDEPD